MVLKSIIKILTLNKTKVLVDQAIFSGNNFISTLLLVRILSPKDFGVYASIILGVYLIISVLSALVIQPFQVNLSRVSSRSSYINFNLVFQLSLVLGVLLIAFLIIKLNLEILAFYNELGNSLILLIMGMTMQDFLRKLFLANGQLRNALYIDLITAIVQTSLLIGLLIIGIHSLAFVISLLGISFFPAIVIGVLLIRFNFNKLHTWKSYLSFHYHQGKWLLMTAIVQWWSSNLFVVASGVFLGIKALGAFRLVQTLFGAFNMVLQTFENYVLPQVSKLLAISTLKATSYIKRVSYKSSLFFLTILIPLFIFSKQIIVLVGSIEYIEYSYVVRGMCILYVLIFLGYPIRISIRALILNRNFFKGYVFSLLFSLITFNYLLKEWGLKGVIIGLIVSQCIVLSYWQSILIKEKFHLWK